MPPPSLAKEAQKACGSYAGKDVMEQLKHDFHDKCYICELKPSDVEVEHLLPHYNRTIKERIFDWNNLFLSCRHCNGIKNRREYDEKIIDCCRDNPESLLDHRIENRHVRIQAKDQIAEKTAELIEASFEEGSTGIRVHAGQFRYTELAKEMDTLYVVLKRYRKCTDQPRNLRSLRSLLSRESQFAAFKRFYVRQHLAEYPGLADYIT